MKKFVDQTARKFPFLNRFLTGLIVSLALALTAFEWTTVTYEPIIDWEVDRKDNIEEILPPITYQLNKAKKVELKKPSNQMTLVKDIIEPLDLKPAPVVKPQKKSLPPIAPIDPNYFGRDDFDKVDDNLTYEKVQVFAHYKKCVGLSGEALQKCSQEDIQQRIFKNFKTTPQLRSIGGRQASLISFVVDKEGNIMDIEVEQSSSKAMSKAAIIAIEKLPKLDYPANQQGRNVALRMKIPILLELRQ